MVTAPNEDLLAAINNRVPFCGDLKRSRDINIVMCRSNNSGKTWSQGKIAYMGSSAYSSLTVLKNVHIRLVFEKDDYTKNEFVSFSLDWLTDGKDTYKKPK